MSKPEMRVSRSIALLTNFIRLVRDRVVVAEHGESVRRRRSLLTAENENKVVNYLSLNHEVQNRNL